ncbi:hypothetical protein BJ138DRAFT_1115382 [Hygrophoropsis aurantiaca]|uniref:Uncharacterized protein n=1 Tax=Hygrophoropsis aurantiaca TaxID=72124 RepID=A0ACB8A6W8_9AGAM|nr:hypothetical protein BJ138DRAFT_1115382 [Hygrophoropsis aurantiaca]
MDVMIYSAWTQGFASEQYSSNSSTATGYCANEVLAASPPSSSAPPPPSSSDSSSGPSSSSEPPATSSAVSSSSVSSVIVTSTNSLGNVTYYYTSAILPTLSPSGSPIVAAVKSTPMPMGAIIGAAVGGVVLIALLVLTGLCYRRRHKKSSASGTRGPPIGEAWDDRRVLGPRIISRRAPTSGGDDASLFSDSAPSNRHDSQASLLHTSMFGSSLSPVRAEHGLRPHPNLPRLDELSSQPPAADTSAEKTADISLSNWNSHSNVHRNAEIPDVPLSPGLTTSSLLLSPQPTRRVVIEEDAGHLDGHRPPTARLPPAYNPAWDSRD